MVLAYVDPGLGALLWQTAIAAFVGFVFYLKKTRRLVVGFVCKIFRIRTIEPKTPPSVVKKEESKHPKEDHLISN
jgi:hypothetical protein